MKTQLRAFLEVQYPDILPWQEKIIESAFANLNTLTRLNYQPGRVTLMRIAKEYKDHTEKKNGS